MVGLFVRAGLSALKAVKPLKKIVGSKTVEQVKAAAAKAKLDTAKFNLKETFKKSDEVLNKLKTTAKKQKKILEE
jgi:type II secretory pathway component PulF